MIVEVIKVSKEKQLLEKQAAQEETIAQLQTELTKLQQDQTALEQRVSDVENITKGEL